MTRLTSRKALAIGLLAGLAAVASGALPKLPQDRVLPQGPDSPGVVTFSHRSHLDEKRPDCTVCHPKVFTILASSKPPVAKAGERHAEMEQGRSCGACHDGNRAHALDDCAACHVEK
jgi:c(7)-type cytochrome triheme protein